MPVLYRWNTRMIIATRILSLSWQGSIRPVEVRIHAPVPNQSSWDCEFEIDWPEAPRRKTIGGVDSTQALFLALEIVGAEIYASAHNKSGRLFWEVPGSGYGFPVPSSIRDLFEGDDIRFFS
jgi:hypothetical protein